MIQITSNNPIDFEYDVRNLVMAFFPGENVKIGDPTEEEAQIISLSSVTPWRFDWSAMGVCEEYIPDEAKLTDRTFHKNEWKRFIYRCLSLATGKKLPWGTLTGIRPTKLPLHYIAKTKANMDETRRWMKEEFLCSDAKASLGVQIATRENELVQGLDRENTYSLYVGIPFCPTTCSYCSFASFSLERFRGLVDSYVEALVKEIEGCKDCFSDRDLTTVYMGGGTPTALTAEQLRIVICAIKEHFPVSTAREFTIEAGRPDSITIDKLRVMKDEGVTRISVNPQTMYEPTLEIIGRKHTVAQTREAMAMAREVGFTNINMDLIAGLPGETPAIFRETLQEVRQMNPDSLTIHSLVVKRASRLREWMDAHQEEKSADYVDEMQQMGYDYCLEEGYAPYYMYRQKHKAALTEAAVRENIGYARYGKEGLYNIMIMEEIHPILALGAGASTKIVYPQTGRIDRIENVKSVTDYIERVDEMIARKTGQNGGQHG